MKKKLLLLAVAMLSVLGASAQWVKPEVKSLDPAEVANAGSLVRIYNVEYGAFLGGANAWGTQTSLLEDGLDYKLEKSDNGNDYKLLTSSGAKSGKYLFRDNDSGCFIDMGDQNRGFNWTIAAVGNGFYTIQSPLDDVVYGVEAYEDAAEKFFGWNGDKNIVYANVRVEDFDEDGNQKPCGIEWAFMSVEDAAALAEALKPYNAAMALKAVIDQAKADYPEIDCSKAEAVYNNTSSTVEELTEAKSLVANAIAAVHTAEVLAGATAEDPKDGTELIVNHDFSTGDISGWVNTFVSGTTANNCGYQSNNYTGPVYVDDETGEQYTPVLTKFIEAWANNVDAMKRDGKSFATVGDAKLYQTIYGLPAGKYKLACDAVAVQQWKADENPVTGVQLYVIGGDIDSHVELSSGDGKPEHRVMTFIHTGGDVELGLRTKSTTANWIAASNFTLLYFGEIQENPFQILLNDYVATIEKKYGDMDDVMAKASVEEDFMAVLEEAQGAADGESDEYYQELQAKLEAAVKDLEASIAAYEKLAAAIENVESKQAEIEEIWPDLAGEITDSVSEWKEGYENGEYDLDQIDEINDKLSTMIANYISENCKAGDDVTILLNNPGFTKSFDGWTMGGAGVVWQDNYGNGENIAEAAANMEAPERNDGLAEKWHAKFTMTQTIKNMPRGLYTLSCQGFNRHDDGEDDAAAELYAILPDGSIQTAPFADIDDYATEEKLFDNTAGTDADPTNYWRSDSERNGKWAPNSMTGAAWHFMNKSDGENYDYTSKFNIVMTEAGDLTVGARCEYEHQWVIFDNFRIVYQGSGAGVYADAIADKIKEVIKVLENKNHSEAVATEVDNVIAAAEKAAEGDNEEACIEALKNLDDAIASINASAELIAKLQAEYETITNVRMNGVESGDEAYQDVLDEIDGALEAVDFASDDTVNDYIASLKAGFTAYVQYDGLKTATEADPYDMTAAIYNTKAVDPATVDAETPTNSYVGWTTNPGTVGLDGKSFELYNQDYDFSQTIYGMAPGYYRLKVQGFYRNGWSENIAKSMRGETNFEYKTRIDEATGDTIKNDEGEAIVDTIPVPILVNKLAELYAGSAATPMLLINEKANIEAYTALEGAAGQTWKGADGNDLIFINSMAQAATAFEAGLYENILQFEVAEKSDVTIGIRKSEKQDGDWTIFTNWRLEYLGTNAPAEDPTTAIVSVDDKGAVRMIFDLTGRRVNNATKGIFIIDGKKVVR